MRDGWSSQGTGSARRRACAGLLDAFPSIRGPKVPLTGIPGSPPNLADPPSGCRFQPRCPKAFEDCPKIAPELYQVGPVQARCLLHAPGHIQAEEPVREIAVAFLRSR